MKINLGSAWRCQRKWVTGANKTSAKKWRVFLEFHPLKKEMADDVNFINKGV